MKHYTIILCLTMILFASCMAPRAYFPDRVNTPQLTQKGDANASAGLKLQLAGGGTEPNNDVGVNWTSPQLDASYAVGDHIGVFTSLRTMIDYEQYEPDDNFNKDFYRTIGGITNGYRVDVGGGFFTKVGSKGLIEFYTGFGMGYLDRKGDKMPQFDFDTRYYRIFVQPSGTFFAREGYAFTWGMRIALQRYYNFNSADPLMQNYITTQEFFVGDAEGKPLTAGIYPMIEPFANFRFHAWRWININLQLGVGASPVSRYFNRMPGGGYLDLGIVLKKPMAKK